MKTFKLIILNTNDEGYNEIIFKGSFKKASILVREHAIKKYKIMNDRKDLHYGILDSKEHQILTGFVAYYHDDVKNNN